MGGWGNSIISPFFLEKILLWKNIVNFLGCGGDYYGGKLLLDSNLRAMINKRNQVSLLIFFSLFSVVVLLINNDLDSEKLKPIVAC